MKILDSSVNLQSYHEKMVQYEQKTSFEFHYQESNVQSASVKLEQNLQISSYQSEKMIFDDEEMLSPKDKINKIIIEKLLSAFFEDGKKVKLYPSDHHKAFVHKPPMEAHYMPQQSRPSWGALIEIDQSYYQKQTIEFSTSATIKTANAEFSIDLSISYSHEFYERNRTQIAIGEQKLKDPLVIHFDDSTNAFDNISNMKFMFDLDNDGEADNIPLLKKGAGFLALDKNNNGMIDNGKELFGPNSGHGFTDLKYYDEDGNNWIDENDSIFKDLRVWQKDDSGNDNLIALGKMGIGAIYLASVTSEFSYMQSSSQVDAQLAANSIYLNENGKAGVISEVDLAV